MSKLTILLLGAVSILPGACGGSPAITGRYDLDAERYKNELLDIMVAQGAIPAGQRANVYDDMRDLDEVIDLGEDGTFSHTQTLHGTVRVKRGTWQLDGTSFRLDESPTAGGDEPLRMRGTLVGGELSVVRSGDKLQFRYHLYHESVGVPAAPR